VWVAEELERPFKNKRERLQIKKEKKNAQPHMS
jgi:hypothetical protein